MPRLRRNSLSAELQTVERESVQRCPAEARRSSLRDPARFFRAIAELERARGLRVHPESPTMH
jgi:hypothetical protein